MIKTGEVSDYADMESETNTGSELAINSLCYLTTSLLVLPQKHLWSGYW